MMSRIIAAEECDTSASLSTDCHAFAEQRTERTSERGNGSFIHIQKPGTKNS